MVRCVGGRVHVSVSRTRAVVGFGIFGPDLAALYSKGSTLSII
jgi:hypothetical protein